MERARLEAAVAAGLPWLDIRDAVEFVLRFNVRIDLRAAVFATEIDRGAADSWLAKRQAVPGQANFPLPAIFRRIARLRILHGRQADIPKSAA